MPKQHLTPEERQFTMMAGGGEVERATFEEDPYTPFVCHCPAALVSPVQLHFCGMFKSCQVPGLTARVNYSIMVK